MLNTAWIRYKLYFAILDCLYSDPLSDVTRERTTDQVSNSMLNEPIFVKWQNSCKAMRPGLSHRFNGEFVHGIEDWGSHQSSTQCSSLRRARHRSPRAVFSLLLAQHESASTKIFGFAGVLSGGVHTVTVGLA